MTTTRYPNGINNATLPSIFEEMGQLDPSRFHNYFNDFNLFNDGVPADWVVTTVETGTGSASEVIQDEDGGVLLLTNDDALFDSDFLQLTNETFKFEVGKKLYFKSRIKVSDDTQPAFIMGLQIRDTTPLDVTDGVFFQKDGNDTDLDFHVEKDNVATTATAIHTIVSDTYLDVGFFYNGIDAVAFYVNDEELGTLPVTNLPDDEELTVSFGVQNAQFVPNSMSIDYIFVAKER